MKKHNTVRVAVADLAPHPLNEKLYGPPSAKADGELAASMREYGQRSPIIICGKRCAHPEGTILAGHRRARAARAAGWKHLDAIVMDGLSEQDEEKEILSDNLAGYEHRKLTRRQKFEHEERVRELSGRKQGDRNDLDPSKPAGNTDTILGASLGSTPNEIRSRRKVFTSPVLVPELEAALEDGTVPLTLATSWTREVEHSVAAKAATEDQGRDELRARVAAKRDEVKARGGVGRRGKRRRQAMPLTTTSMPSASDGNAEPPTPSAMTGIKKTKVEEFAEALRRPGGARDALRPRRADVCQAVPEGLQPGRARDVDQRDERRGAGLHQPRRAPGRPRARVHADRAHHRAPAEEGGLMNSLSPPQTRKSRDTIGAGKAVAAPSSRDSDEHPHEVEAQDGRRWRLVGGVYYGIWDPEDCVRDDDAEEDADDDPVMFTTRWIARHNYFFERSSVRTNPREPAMTRISADLTDVERGFLDYLVVSVFAAWPRCSAPRR
jgi:ParB-like chromosome segregation protein Spo0J